MSFRLFIYYCAVCGGCAAFLGWALGRMASMENDIARTGLRGMFLGMLVAFGLSLVDALGNQSAHRVFNISARVFVAVLVGCLGGMLGGVIGQLLYNLTQMPVSFVFGWALVGVLIGVSLGFFDLLVCMVRQEDSRGAQRKILNGVIGGGLGGVLGGILALSMESLWKSLFHMQIGNFWSPVATGFVALGVCIGLLIGLCQVILKEAWLKVEKGFRAGRELLLSRPEMTIGRAEGCDLGLFGDAGIEKIHARIKRQGADYYLYDEGTPGGTWINDERVHGTQRLHSGDVIRVGKCLVRFGERQKRES
jgi:hypothetical protein